MIFLVATLFCLLPSITISDNLKLLSNSLRRLESSGCEELSLSCPGPTSILLLNAKYTGILCSGASSGCNLPPSLQYSLLQTAVERCQKKDSCKLDPSDIGFGTDPCPGIRKHLHVTYSCRPYEFRSKTTCEDEKAWLECGPNSRLAIYSASYGRTQYESVHCPQPQGVPEETCLASYATEKVIDFCHGKRRCSITVDSTTFGNPCNKDSRMYLKVVYTCVPRQVLLPIYDQRPEEDEALDRIDEWSVKRDGGLAAPNTIGQHGSRNDSLTLHRYRGDAVPTYNPNEKGSSDKHHRDLVMYVLLGGGAVVACLLLLLVARIFRTRRKPQNVNNQLPPFETQLGGDVQADLTVVCPLPMEPSEVIRFPEKEVPRSLSSSDPQYFFG